VTECREPFDPLSDLEAMVRAAGGYVQPSEDLRPRVLEAARAQQGEKRARRWIRRAAACVVLVAVLAASASRMAGLGVDPELALNATDSQAMHSRAESYSSGRDLSWGLVKAFTELRRRQSAAFRL
jgi:hypothetical protein